ncbi:sigma-70 family RNA polymerase sigma factor [Candidatus Dojkabacteria bacterium]|nr:sigma-70 family RNA polymerase sigma factor [Candidatus Dojkabacteria bacterium]
MEEEINPQQEGTAPQEFAPERFTRMTRMRQFVHACCPNELAWDRVAAHLTPLIQIDIALTSARLGRESRFSAQEIMHMARLYLFEGYRLQDIVVMLPTFEETNVNGLATLVRDLLILADPQTAEYFGYSQGNCTRRALRIYGAEARTRFQRMYQEVLSENVEAFDPSSEIYQCWAAVLCEFRSPLANQGKILDVDPEAAIELVRLIFLEGHNFSHAAEQLDIVASTGVVRRVAFVSLYVLKDILSAREEASPTDLVFPVYPKTRTHLFLAENMIELAQERELLAEVVADVKARYRDTERPPYLNPLQLAVLEAYTSYDFDALIADFHELGMTQAKFLAQFVALRRVALGQEFYGECPFRREFRDLVLYYACQENQGNEAFKESNCRYRLWSRTLAYSDHDPIPFSVCLTRYLAAKPHQAPVFARVPYGQRSFAIRQRIQGAAIRTIGSEIGIGKNSMFKFFLQTEHSVVAYYFPSYAEVRNELNLSGLNMTSYLQNRHLHFSGRPGPGWTIAEQYAWEIAEKRAAGLKASDIMKAYEMSEAQVSAFTFLAVIASLKYLHGKQSVDVEYLSEPQGDAYAVHLNRDRVTATIGRNVVQLTQRELCLLEILLRAKGNPIRLDRVYEVLYPDEVSKEHRKSAWEKIIYMLNRLEDRLGRDAREQPLFSPDHVTRTFRLNPARWECTGREARVFYAHSPFGSVRSFIIADKNILYVEFFDGHDRYVQLTTAEAQALHCLLQNTQNDHGWVHYNEMISEILTPDDQREGLYLVRNALDGLQRKLGIPYPLPGHIMSDNLGRFRVVTYLDETENIHQFRTATGVYHLRENILAVFSISGELVTRLTRGQSQTLITLLYGTTSSKPGIKHSLRLELEHSGVLPTEARGFFWERHMELLSYADYLEGEEKPWTKHLTVVSAGNTSVVSIFNGEGFVRAVEIPSKYLPLLSVDAMDPDSFAPALQEASKETEALMADTANLPALDLDRLARQAAIEYPMLSQEAETILLIRMAAGDTSAKTRLFRSNMRLAWSPALQAYWKSDREVEFLDILQEGYLGLLKALDRFDPTIEGSATPMGRVSTYATWWIVQHVNRFMANHSRNIRIPVHRQTFNRRVYSTMRRLAQPGRMPTPEEITHELLPHEDRMMLEVEPCPPEVLKRYKRLLQKVIEAMTVRDEISLSTPLSDEPDADEIADRIEDDTSNPLVPVEHSLLADKLMEIIADLHLSERDQDIILRRFGLLDGQVYTLEEIATLHGLTRERIRQIEGTVLRRIRHPRYKRQLPKPD